MTGVSDSRPTLLLVVACLFLTTTGFSFSQPQTAHQLGTDRVMSAALAYPGSPITPRVSAGLQAGIADRGDIGGYVATTFFSGHIGANGRYYLGDALIIGLQSELTVPFAGWGSANTFIASAALTSTPHSAAGPTQPNSYWNATVAQPRQFPMIGLLAFTPRITTNPEEYVGYIGAEASSVFVAGHPGAGLISFSPGAVVGLENMFDRSPWGVQFEAFFSPFVYTDQWRHLGDGITDGTTSFHYRISLGVHYEL